MLVRFGIVSGVVADGDGEAILASFERNVAAKNTLGKRNSERYIFHRYIIFVIVISWSDDAGSVA